MSSGSLDSCESIDWYYDSPSSDGEGDAAVIANKSVPWSEKYRPMKLEDVDIHLFMRGLIRKCVLNPNNYDSFPNLLFHGPPGTGKTSTIMAICRKMYGELYGQRVLELNASDDRGIQVVREKIKGFAQLSALPQKLKSGVMTPPFKVVILDEADAMTSFAQAALRRTMETESRHTRFCLICNYVSKIIEPIFSRCMIIHFREVTSTLLKKRIKRICRWEGFRVTEEALMFIIEQTAGDLRKAINTLQCGSRTMDVSQVEVEQNKTGKPTRPEISTEHLKEALGIIPDTVFDDITKWAQMTLAERQLSIKKFLKTGYSMRQLLHQIQKQLTSANPPNCFGSVERIPRVLEKLAIIDKRLLDGASEYLQLLDLFTFMSKS